MVKYSVFSLARNALSYHERWPLAWRNPTPKDRYDVVIIGGGGHGLASAYYLAKEHGINDVAVLEKGWLGSGNVGRNTTVVRSNYLIDESAAIYERSLQLWEGLSEELNFNVMFSQRGVLHLGHNRHEMHDIGRRAASMQLNGIDAEILTNEQVARHTPLLNTSAGARYPILGALLQRRGGTVRHDAVAWGFARGADAYGVDIIQNCEVTGIQLGGGKAVGVETSRGFIKAGKVVACAAGHSSVIGDMVGLRLPIETYSLQALVTEPVKPVLDCVVMSTAVGLYVSQSDKGGLVMGGATDRFTSYGQRSSLHVVQAICSAAMELFPALGRIRVLRQWAGACDVSPDASPIVGKSPIDNFYLNCGWGTGGFKATPVAGWVMAYTIANDRPHPLNEPYALDRFTTGRIIDEQASTGAAH